MRYRYFFVYIFDEVILKKESKEKKIKSLEEELNIRYHDVNPEWNYTISPRSAKSTEQVQK
jgi:hypothetical protein